MDTRASACRCERGAGRPFGGVGNPSARSSRARPQVGTITARSLVDGEMVARIEAPASYSGFSGSTEVVVVELKLPIEYHRATTIPVRILSDGSVEIVQTRLRMPATSLLIVVGFFGALAGLVIIFNLRGFGFVRGTGEHGTMQPSEVDEDRGFYWRS